MIAPPLFLRSLSNHGVEQLLLDHGMEHYRKSKSRAGLSTMSGESVSKGIEQCMQSRGGADLQVCGKANYISALAAEVFRHIVIKNALLLEPNFL